MLWIGYVTYLRMLNVKYTKNNPKEVNNSYFSKKKNITQPITQGMNKTDVIFNAGI